MIVRYTKSGWEIITQRGHGLLAAEICARWKLSDQPNRWVETLVACAGHDDAFNEFEGGNLITEKGGPINFDMGSFNEESSQYLMDMAITKSYFTALLIARHIDFTHGSDKKAKKFLATLKKQEKLWIKIADTSINELERAYELLELCDAFSLLICQNVLQPEERSLEISTGPDGTKYFVIAAGNTLSVTPWPFEIDNFEVSYEVRNLPKLAFESSSEFVNLLKSTYPERITLRIKQNL